MFDEFKVKPKAPSAIREKKSAASRKAKFVLFGEEILDKRVSACGTTGRVYVPPTWIGKTIKIVRVDNGQSSSLKE